MWKKPVVKAEFSSTGYLQQRGRAKAKDVEMGGAARLPEDNPDSRYSKLPARAT